MSRLLTFGNIASAIGCLAAGFALGQALTGSARYEEGLLEGRGKLSAAEDALTKLNEVISDPTVTTVYTSETREKLAALSEAVAARDYERIDTLLPFELALVDEAGCLPNGKADTITPQDNIRVNCETGVTAVFVVLNPNRIDTTLGTQMKSLTQGHAGTWELPDGQECSVLVSHASIAGDNPTATILFQDCKGS
ncbi:hypothetical protein [Antarctobacter jejuensis]|uniref:hypothetical protein n=1 Tax=Antarctobacter jejuensis TaxID=1439938 RepID=UPI003FD69BB2